MLWVVRKVCAKNWNVAYLNFGVHFLSYTDTIVFYNLPPCFLQLENSVLPKALRFVYTSLYLNQKVVIFRFCNCVIIGKGGIPRVRRLLNTVDGIKHPNRIPIISYIQKRKTYYSIINYINNKKFNSSF